MYCWITLLHNQNWHNVSQLCSNIKSNLKVKLRIGRPPFPSSPPPYPFIQYISSVFNYSLTLLPSALLHCYHSAAGQHPKVMRTAGASSIISLLPPSRPSSPISLSVTGVISKTWVRSCHAAADNHPNSYRHTQKKFSTLHLGPKVLYHLASVCLSDLILHHFSFSCLVFHDSFPVSVWSGLSEQSTSPVQNMSE